MAVEADRVIEGLDMNALVEAVVEKMEVAYDGCYRAAAAVVVDPQYLKETCQTYYSL